jgi:hypothetical protein
VSAEVVDLEKVRESVRGHGDFDPVPVQGGRHCRLHVVEDRADVVRLFPIYDYESEPA